MGEKPLRFAEIRAKQRSLLPVVQEIFTAKAISYGGNGNGTGPQYETIVPLPLNPTEVKREKYQL